MSIQYFIDLYEKNAMTEATLEEMEHFAFSANDDELFILAQLYAALGLASKAVDVVEPLLEKYPNETNLKTFLADLYLDLAEDEKVLDLLSSNEEQTDVNLLMLEADMYITQGLFEVAEEKIKKALALEPQNNLIKLAYAEFYHHIGEFEAALNLYLDLVDFGLSNEINVYERLATCYSHIGEFEKAVEQFDLSEKFFGDLTTDQLFNKGFLAFTLKQYETARKVFEKLKEVDPTYDSIYPLLSKMAFNEKDYEKTLEWVKEGISYNEYNPELFFLKASALEGLQLIEEARDAYYEALNLDPDDITSALRSNAICFQLEDYEEVIANINHYEESGLTDERFTWDLALANLKLEEYDEAAQYFEQAYPLFKKDVDFLYDYSQFLVEEGLREKAASTLNQLLSIEPTHAEARELLDNLM
ncbi:MAG TPA: hypothetical protein DCY20_03860 [Firmicutes bacterium]|nr:hypothetical protein [Bacillota bacterium]